MDSIFKFLGSSFGLEDFFTASLGLFLKRDEALRDAFIAWLAPHLGSVPLRDYRWEVAVQVARPSCAGDAILDMVLSNGHTELWFEHKVDAGTGVRISGDGRSLDQIEKYLDAAARHMLKLDKGKSAIEWTADRFNERPGPRVFVFYITKSDVKLKDIGQYGAAVVGANENPGVGLVWCGDRGHLKWADFWTSAQTALGPLLSGARGEGERFLAEQFVQWWESIPGMTNPISNPDATWQELLDENAPNAKRDGKVGFASLWSMARNLTSIGELHWLWKDVWLGVAFDISAPKDSRVLKVLLRACATPSSEKAAGALWSSTLESEFIAMLVTFREDSGVVVPRRGAASEIHDGAFRARWAVMPEGGVRIVVGLPNWKEALDNGQRGRLIARGVQAGLRMVESIVNERVFETDLL